MTLKHRQSRHISLLLHNIRSAHNVGAMFRTADAIGIERIYLTGYTPTPLDRFGRPVKEIAKTALGSERTIPWETHKKPDSFIAKNKATGVEVIGIEQDKRSIDYKKYQSHNREQRVLIVVGNEVRGMSKGLRDKCDVLIEIPMHGKKESLNVSVAFGIALFRLFDQ